MCANIFLSNQYWFMLCLFQFVFGFTAFTTEQMKLQ